MREAQRQQRKAERRLGKLIPETPQQLGGGDPEDRDEESLEQQEADAAASSEMPMPCTFGSLGAAGSGGAMGFVFGFAPAVLRHDGPERWKLCALDGLGMAKSFALAAGMYSFVACVAQRLRMVDDNWNSVVGSVASGIALGWSGGPKSALLSAAAMGAITLFTGVSESTAAEVGSTAKRPRQRALARRRQSRRKQQCAGAVCSLGSGPSCLLCRDPFMDGLANMAAAWQQLRQHRLLAAIHHPT